MQTKEIWETYPDSKLNGSHKILCKCMKSDAEVIGGCLTTSEIPLVCEGLCNVQLLEMALKYGALI